MLILFIISLAVLFYIFIGYPAVIALLSFAFGRTVRKKDATPPVTLLISAYNEEKVIRQKLQNSLSLDYPKDRLDIVVASESKDGTNDIVKEYAPKGVVLYHYDKREGKRATLFRTVPLVKGEIIVFSDANAMYRADAIKKLVRNFSDERIGCVSGRLVYQNPNDSSIGKGENTYWEYDFILKKMLSRLFSLAGSVNGSIFAIRRNLYDPIDRYRGDDFEISCRVEINGHGVVMEPEAISNEDSSESTKQEFSRKVRLATWNFKSTLLLLKDAVKKGRLFTAYLLFSHRFLRYTTPLWLILLFISNAFMPKGALGYFLFLQAAFYLFALAGLVLEKKELKVNALFLIPLYFCMVNYAAFLGLAKNFFGKTESLWEKAR